jgi:hypothetical protein
MRTLLLLLLFPGLLSAMAQDGPPPVKLFERYGSAPVVDTPATDTSAAQRQQGDVRIFADPAIERLMEQHAAHKHVQKGYRVQIFLGTRRLAEETRRAFVQKHPDIPAYISWLAPNFRVRVGDLRTRLEAENLLRQLKAEHPGSYIVPDEIEMSRSSAER